MIKMVAKTWSIFQKVATAPSKQGQLALLFLVWYLKIEENEGAAGTGFFLFCIKLVVQSLVYIINLKFD